MARALILDFGGVISRTLFETHASTEAALGLTPGVLTWRGPFDPDSDALWCQMQAGEISERDYWRRRSAEVGAMIGAEWAEMSNFVRAARGAEPEAIIRPEARAAISAVAEAGLALAILSNELDLFYGAAFRDKLPLLQKFDVIHDATYSGILKPDPRAYQACLAALDLEAADCVFVDDQARNIAGAEAVGLQVVKFDVRHPAAGYNQALALLGLKEHPDA